MSSAISRPSGSFHVLQLPLRLKRVFSTPSTSLAPVVSTWSAILWHVVRPMTPVFSEQDLPVPNVVCVSDPKEFTSLEWVLQKESVDGAVFDEGILTEPLLTELKSPLQEWFVDSTPFTSLLPLVFFPAPFVVIPQGPRCSLVCPHIPLSTSDGAVMPMALARFVFIIQQIRELLPADKLDILLAELASLRTLLLIVDMQQLLEEPLNEVVCTVRLQLAGVPKSPFQSASQIELLDQAQSIFGPSFSVHKKFTLQLPYLFVNACVSWHLSEIKSRDLQSSSEFQNGEAFEC